MPRYRRIVRPGDLVHVISRIVNREFRIRGDEERAEYLERLGDRLRKSDWKCVSYGLMSNHVHTAHIAGLDSFESLMKSIHAPYAGWLNKRQGRLGPVFAGRPQTITVAPVWMGRLVAYHHNNPPRAGVVELAVDSDWTSHRAYLGLAPRPDWLAVDLCLELLGLQDTPAGREAFDAYVRSRQWAPRDIRLTGDVEREDRELRRQLRASVCLAHPSSSPGGIDYDTRVPAKRWNGDLTVVIECVARALGVSMLSISSRRRDASVSAARRQVALVAGALGCTNREIGLALGISEAGVRILRSRARPEDHALARQVFGEVVTREKDAA